MSQTLLTVVLPTAVMIACAGLGWLLNNLANSMPADQRQLWLHRAAVVALLLSGLGSEALSRALTPEEEHTVAGSINQFLALHKVSGKVSSQDVAVVLADLRLKAAQVAPPPPPPAPPPTPSTPEFTRASTSDPSIALLAASSTLATTTTTTAPAAGV